mgnify:CR=1 FL=1
MLMELFGLLVLIVVLGGVYWLFRWAIAEIGLPDPFGKIANVVAVLVVLFVVLFYILPKVMALFGLAPL